MNNKALEAGEPTREEMRNYNARLEVAHDEYLDFVSTLPSWVTRFERGDLFMMTRSERKRWLQNNSPILRNTVEKPSEKIGSVRI